MNTMDYEKTAMHVSRLSILGNAALTLAKLFAGIFAHSGAMVSDAVHSASDVFSTIIVMIGIRIASREADREHPYGHERLECVAAIVLAGILAATGLMIGWNAAEKLMTRAPILRPGRLALAAAVLSIIAKEIMYRYTAGYARRLNSDALMADAWHHRSDALSSVGSLIGIAGARIGLLWLDAAASLVICGFILKAAYDIFIEGTEKLVDHACSCETEAAIRDCALKQAGVLGIDLLITREFGRRIYVDMEIGADGDLTLRESHAIAERVHDAIEAAFPNVKHIMVHVNPAEK